MKFYAHNFIGKNEAGKILLWSGQDTLDSFSKNIKSSASNWPYRSTHINYIYNSLGHRSREIESINLNDYILTIGCSHTEGIGVSLDDSYPFVLSKMLNSDYYNLGLGSTGIDVLMHNLSIWFAVIEKKPKLLIIQVPDQSRSITGDEHNLQPRGSWDDDPENLRFMDSGTRINFFSCRAILLERFVKTCINIPTIYLNIGGLKPIGDDTVTCPVVDLGRDMKHPGILSHYKFAKSIYDYLINNQCLNFYQNIELKN